MTETVHIGEKGKWWDGEPGYLWADDGGVALQNAHDQAAAEQYVRFYEEEGLYWCAGHYAWHPKPHAFRRFAGLYCAEAAEEYKSKNSRACLICRRPIWDCYC